MKIEQDQYDVYAKHVIRQVGEPLFLDGFAGLCNLCSTFFKYPTKTFANAFFSQIAHNSDDSENSIYSSKDGVDDCQTLTVDNSLKSDDPMNTGAGHDISHNQDKTPSVDDETSSSID